MKAKKFRQDNSAVSEVLGVVLIIGILVTAFSIVISISLPQWTKSFEAAHASEVADDFSELASQIDGIVLVAKLGDDAAGTTAIKMKADQVPVIGMSPPGSSLEFSPDKDRFYITPYASTDPAPPPGVAGFWEETTTADFLNYTRKANVDLNFDKIKLSRTDMVGELIIENTTTTLDGVYLRDNIEIRNSTVYLVPNSYLKLYANIISIDATSEIIANESGYSGGRGGNLGAGPGFGRYGLNGSGGGGAGYYGFGGDGGRGEYSIYEGGNVSDVGLRGRPYGDNTSLSFVLGSGGGGGASGKGTQAVPHQGTVGGSGGSGGGAVFLNAQQIIVHGAIYADGAAGSAGIGALEISSGGGGGGSGGTILIQGDDVNLSSATLSANGGAGGAGGTQQGNTNYGGGGGGGSGGRIKIFYGSTCNNTTLDHSVALGVGGTADPDALGGENGSAGDFYENQTAYISGIFYKDEGYYESSVFNTSSPTTCYYNITWEENTNNDTKITVKVRTSIYEEMDEVNATPWGNCDEVVNGQNLTDLNSVFDWHQYIQYHVDLFTYDETMTPVFREVNITYNTSDPAGGSPVIAESTGMVKFKSGHIYYPKQEIAYEHGAVLKCQREKGEEDGIVIQPPPILISNKSGIPEIDISMINLTGSNDSYSGTTALSLKEENIDEPKTRSTKFHNLSLNITTEYPVIWGKWFNDTLAESGLHESRYEVMKTGDYVVVDFYGDEQHVHLVEVDKTDVEVEMAT